MESVKNNVNYSVGDSLTDNNPHSVFRLLHGSTSEDVNAMRKVVLEATDLSSERKISLLRENSEFNVKMAVLEAQQACECALLFALILPLIKNPQRTIQALVRLVEHF